MTSPSPPTSRSCSAGSPSAARSRSPRPATTRAGWTPSPTRRARTITVDVAFGGSAGQNSGSAQSKVVDTSSGDTTIGADDKWVEVANPSTAGVSNRGPSAVVNGTQSGTGNFQRDPFGNPLPLTGLEANFYGYKNTLTLAPGQTKSLLRYVVAGRAEAAATAGQQVAAVKTRRERARRRAGRRGHPRGRRLHGRQLGAAVRRGDLRRLPRSRRHARAAGQAPVTTSGYDVVGKSITQLEADMESGLHDLAGDHARLPGPDRRL